MNPNDRKHKSASPPEPVLTAEQEAQRQAGFDALPLRIEQPDYAEGAQTRTIGYGINADNGADKERMLRTRGVVVTEPVREFMPQPVAQATMPKGDYIDDAHRTLSPQFYGDQMKLDDLRATVSAVIIASQSIDAIKKTLFYGKVWHALKPDNRFESVGILLGQSANHDKAAQVNLLHAAIGMVTEAGEFLQAVFNALYDGKPIDNVNLLEEIGDNLWYQAIALRAIGKTFEEAQSVNIAKLRKRFPAKFTEAEAETRDLAAERSVLETGAIIRMRSNEIWPERKTNLLEDFVNPNKF